MYIISAIKQLLSIPVLFDISMILGVQGLTKQEESRMLLLMNRVPRDFDLFVFKSNKYYSRKTQRMNDAPLKWLF